ncbi:hypothetical protein [Nocardia sp. NPDC059228]|uniref:hypothetical protein n=1 Tax=Nocardia sp. NPDC059228 TaxID=3346777 RepID=UPI0036CD3686
MHYRTRWDDFTERLDCVLHTLPYAAIVIVTPDGHHIQFWNDGSGSLNSDAPMCLKPADSRSR